MYATILLTLAFIFDIIIVTAICAGLEIAFGGQYAILRGIITIVAGFIIGAFVGRYCGRKLLYVSLKRAYKNKAEKKKGETK